MFSVFVVIIIVYLQVIPDTTVLNQDSIKRVKVASINDVQCQKVCWVSYLTRNGDKVIDEVLAALPNNNNKNINKCLKSTHIIPVSTAPHPNDSENNHNNITDVGKKILSQSDLLVMFANTIVSIFSISAAVSLIPRDDETINYTFCTYGNGGEADTVLVQCPYLPSPGFISVLLVWMIYFGVLFAYKYISTSEFSSNDLRYYMACDRHNSRLVHRLLIGAGIVLTVGSGLFGISFIVSNGNDAAVGSILVFMTLNISGIDSCYTTVVTL